jgi:catechol 2,3-dioxygenase-like lactoylglutathione lyase family enzyme
MTADTTPDRPLVKWIALTIDCADPNALADFYDEGIGAEVKSRTDDSAWVVLDGLPIVLRAVEGYRAPTWPSTDVPLQTHFELMVHDPDEAAARLAQHGARYAEHQDVDQPDLVVMIDPAGHPFCLIRSSKAQRP